MVKRTPLITFLRTLPVLFTVRLRKTGRPDVDRRYKDNLLFYENITAVDFLYPAYVWILNIIFITILIFSHLLRDLPSGLFLLGRLSLSSVACMLHGPSSFLSWFYYINNICRKVHFVKLVVLWCYISEQFLQAHIFASLWGC